MSQYARYFSINGSGGSGVSSLNSLTGALSIIAGSGITVTPSGSDITIAATGGGSGTVTSVSIISANGLAGTVATATTTPAITLSTTITGILLGNGTAISAATPGTDYVIPSGSITGTASNITATSNSTLVTLSSLSLPYTQITGAPAALTFADSLVNTAGTVTLVGDASTPGDSMYYGTNGSGTKGYYSLPSPGTGTVTSVSVVSTNGLAGTVATATTTPAITLSTTITGILLGNGTAISAATPGTDYVIPSGSITGTASNITATSNSTLVTLSSLSLPGSQVTGNISGNAANITATSNSTLTTLSALSLSVSQLSGTLLVSQGGTDSSSFNAYSVVFSGTTSTGTFSDSGGPGTSGYVLTSNGPAAYPTWQVNPAAGANTALSNLTTTSINEDLLPASGQNVGSSGSLWSSLWATSLNTTGITGIGITGLRIETPTQTTSHSGLITLASGSTTTANTGAINLITGNSSAGGNSGNIVLGIGAVSGGTSGKILLQDGSQGTAGYVWTSIDTIGSGSWIPASGGGAIFADSLVNTAGTVTLVGDTASPAASQYYGTNSGSTLGYYNLPTGFTNPMTTAGDILFEDATPAPTRLPIGINGQVLVVTSGLPAWTTLSGSSAFVSYASSEITTNSSVVTSPTFTTFDNSPAFTVTPTITGTYKIYCGAPIVLLESSGGSDASTCRIYETSQLATLLYESQGINQSATGGIDANTNYIQSVYTLQAGTTYTFDIQGLVPNSGDSLFLKAASASCYMFAEGIGLTATPVSLRYYSSTSILSGSLSTIIYATQDYDSNSAYSSGVFTAPQAGVYQINAGLLITGTITLNSTLIMQIQVNGSAKTQKTIYLPASIMDASISIADQINLNGGDTVQIQVSTTATLPSIVASNFDNYISICQLR